MSKNKNENKNVNKNIITINGTGSSGSSGSSSVIPIPYSMSTPVAPAPIHIFNEPPSYIPIKQEPLDIKQEIPLPVHQDTPVKSPVKSPFDKIESKVDTPTKVNIDNDIKKRHRVFIEPKPTPVSVNPSDLSNSFFSKKIEDNNNNLSKLIPLNVSSTPIITETYDMDTGKSNWFDNPFKFYDTDTGSSISSITNKSNKSTDKSNKSTANKSTEHKSIEEYKENPNRDIDEYIRRLEQNIEPVKPKRHRRTKEEMIAFRAEQQRIKDEKERIKREKLAEFERKSKIFFDKYG
jgi:hypothetical protein